MNNDLHEIAIENMNILLNLQENDNIIIERNKIKISNDFVQIDNLSQIEYTLYFTLTYLLYNNYNHLEDINRCIDNIYNNKELSSFIEKDDNLRLIIEYIDDIYKSIFGDYKDNIKKDNIKEDNHTKNNPQQKICDMIMNYICYCYKYCGSYYYDYINKVNHKHNLNKVHKELYKKLN